MKYEKMINEFFGRVQSQPKCSFDKIFGGFNKGELGVLRYLENIGKEISSGELSNFFNVSTARIASILNSLEHKNLISRHIDSEDKRKILVNITDDGVKLTQDIKDELEKRIDYLIDEIGISDFEKYLDLTLKIGDILNSYEEETC